MEQYKSTIGTIYYHETPWNSAVMGGNTLEIDSIDAEEQNKTALLTEFSDKKAADNYVLIAARVNGSAIPLKKVYLQSGFIPVEHTLNVVTNGIDVAKLTDLTNRFPVTVEKYVDENYAEVQAISESVFNFGRFYEDPFISDEVASLRNKRWIDDLISQNAIIDVLKKKDKVAGFMAYKLKDNKAELILGGVKENYRHLSYSFWAHVMLSLKDYEEINTLISSSNIGILNLYSYLGFKFENPQVGFHKHI